MTTRVPIAPELLEWACERSGRTVEDLSGRFPRLAQWVSGEAQPTFKQVEDFARATYTPFGYFFLPEPPPDTIPIPDFRTMESARIGRPTVNLLETLYRCQERQAWYSDYARSMGDVPLPFVGSVAVGGDVVATAAAMRDTLGFDLEARRRLPTWTEALRQFIAQADDLGVMVMVTSVVGNNTHRKLDPKEFRGFALADALAPLVFINGSDTKAAQMFTLAHELAHIWLGESALSDAGPQALPDHAVERWCNQVAAELLAPLERVRAEFRADAALEQEMKRLARHFKVSTLVVLRRIHDTGGLTREEFREAYNRELERLLAMPRGSGGDFYLSQGARLSKRFTRAIIVSTLEGQNSWTEAFRLLGVKKMATFRELGTRMGVYT